MEAISPQALVFTATVVPQVTGLYAGTVEERLQEYRNALNFYLNTCSLPIWVCENSGFDWRTDSQLHRWVESGQLHWLAMEAAPDARRGKGYQEFAMLDAANEALPQSVQAWIKVTGRYTVQNIGSFLHPLRGIQIDRHGKLKVALTGFFAVNRDFYRSYLTGLYQQADDNAGRFIEHVVYQALQGMLAQHGAELLPESPNFAGRAGSHGGTLNRHPLKHGLRRWERKLLRSAGMSQFIFEY